MYGRVSTARENAMGHFELATLNGKWSTEMRLNVERWGRVLATGCMQACSVVGCVSTVT
jgi:hypothetical protein